MENITVFEKNLVELNNHKNGNLRVGVIGCGYWGPNLVRNFVEIANAQ
jgi:hypothetical protein